MTKRREPPQRLDGRTWVILGASSPVAREFARLVAGCGASVILAGRDPADLEASAADLSVRHSGTASVQFFDAIDRASQIDLIERCRVVPPGSLDLLLAFAQMPDQAAMEADPALAAQTIGASFTAAAEILLRFAPLLEASKGGTIIVMGSVAGDRGRLKNYVYGSAKAGLAMFTAGLRNRLGRSGVHVLTVKPGFVDTAMTWGSPGIFLAAAPSSLALAMLRAAQKGRDVLYYPFFWALIMLIIRLIPERLFKRLSI